MKIKEVLLTNGEMVLLETFPVNEIGGKFIRFNDNTVINTIQEKEVEGVIIDGSVNIWRKQKNGKYRQHGQLVFTEITEGITGDVSENILILTLHNSFPGISEEAEFAARKNIITNFQNLGFSSDSLRRVNLLKKGVGIGSSWKFMIGS